ncbi:7308_t:CDS:2 [Entrophospora sp. SA101]|nr:7308_t:CDS:2 [Entrophospora sp. SA101]
MASYQQSTFQSSVVSSIYAEKHLHSFEPVMINIRENMGLITSELMACGMYFKGINLVINYDFSTISIQSYIHRIGRTGRAGRLGEAITYYMKNDAPYLKGKY